MHLDATDTHSRLFTPGGESNSPAQCFERLGLSYSPVIVFFDVNGKEAIRLDSETQRFRMEGLLQMVLEESNLQNAQLQRWRREKAVKFFNPG